MIRREQLMLGPAGWLAVTHSLAAIHTACCGCGVARALLVATRVLPLPSHLARVKVVRVVASTFNGHPRLAAHFPIVDHEICLQRLERFFLALKGDNAFFIYNALCITHSKTTHATTRHPGACKERTGLPRKRPRGGRRGCLG